LVIFLGEMLMVQSTLMMFAKLC